MGTERSMTEGKGANIECRGRQNSMQLPVSQLQLDALDFQKKNEKSPFFRYFFGRFSIYLAPSGAKYREKGWAVTKTGEG